MEGKGKAIATFASIRSAIYDKEEKKQQYQAHIRGLNAYDRHNKFLKDYVGFYGNEESKSEKPPVRTDHDTLREGYRFIRTEEDDMDTSWEQRLVKRYYDKLFKEYPFGKKCSGVLISLTHLRYCIADMSHYKSGKIGLRWRTKKEVISGKGQFICGNKHCNEKDGLASYEVNFSYFEAGESKQALVKLVTCQRCSEKLHYKKQKEKEELEKSKRKREAAAAEDDDHSDEDVDLVERKKGKVLSSSSHKHKSKDGGEDDFDSYLEGMFP